MKLARFEVSSDLLKSLLRLPDDCKIIDIGHARWVNGEISVELTVKSPEFVEVLDGENPPTKFPCYRSNGGKVEFEGWH
jgi:hypothetical protein